VSEAISSPYHYTTWLGEMGREGGCVPSPRSCPVPHLRDLLFKIFFWGLGALVVNRKVTL
jgi:hypothetical protein